MLISRLSEIDQIYSYEKEFCREIGIRPYNISSWRVSEQFRNWMLHYIAPPSFGNVIDYTYTYSIQYELRRSVMQKLGVKDYDDAFLLFAPNNTTAIVNVANLLKARQCKKVCIVNPAYFSVAQTFYAMGISYSLESMVRTTETGSFELPYNQIVENGYDAIWITSPVFSTGLYLHDQEIQKIQKLMEKGVLIVADESFALPGKELVRCLGVSDCFIGIYSPHKSISCNNLKFSAVITSDDYEDFLEQWADVLEGNLPQSSCSAIEHFISTNYDDCLNAFLQFTAKTYEFIYPLLHGNNIKIDRAPYGSMFTLYFRNITNEKARTKEFYKQLYANTLTGILPGYLNGFNEEYGLCFRINMALDGIEFRQSIQRLIPYLDAR